LALAAGWEGWDGRDEKWGGAGIRGAARASSFGLLERARFGFGLIGRSGRI